MAKRKYELELDKMKKLFKKGEELTYREICERVGFKTSTSKKTKDSQMKEVQRFLLLEQNISAHYHPYKVIKIYRKELPVEDKRRNNGNDVYSAFFRSLFLVGLYYKCRLKQFRVQFERNGNDNVYYLTNSEIATMVGLVSDSYFKEKERNKEISYDERIMKSKFCISVDNRYKDVIRSCLISLKRKLLISDCNYVYVVRENNNVRRLKPDEEEFATELKKRLLAKQGFYDEFKFIMSNSPEIVHDFYFDVNMKFNEHFNTNGSIYKAYEIIPTRSFLVEGIEEETKEIKDKMDNLNTLFIESVENKLSEMVNNAEGFKFPVSYIDNMKEVLQKFVKLNEDDYRVIKCLEVMKEMQTCNN